MTVTPLTGDRSAFDVTNHPNKHASDLDTNTPVHHVPAGTNTGDILVWDGSKWTADTGGAGASTLDDLTDVNAPAPANDQVLIYDEYIGQWIPGDVPTGGTHGLNDHSDVNAPSPTEGQVLTYDEYVGQWVPTDPTTSGAGDAADLTYSPAVAADWDSSTDPGNADDAFDQLASRVKIIETSANGWTQLINESGASFSNWTSGSGTWSSDGTVIKQTDKTGNWRTAKFNTIQPITPGYILQADIKVVSSGAQTLRLAGLVIGYAGSTSSAGASADMRLSSGTRYIHFMRSFTSDIIDMAQSWNDDTFYTFRIISSGGYIAAYLDGTLVGTAGNSPANAIDARYVGFTCWGCEAHFKNIKGWGLALP